MFLPKPIFTYWLLPNLCNLPLCLIKVTKRTFFLILVKTLLIHKNSRKTKTTLACQSRDLNHLPKHPTRSFCHSTKISQNLKNIKENHQWQGYFWKNKRNIPANSAIKKSIPLLFLSLDECKSGRMFSCFSKPVRWRTYSS